MNHTQEILLKMGFENLNTNTWTSDIFGVFKLHKDATPKQLAEFIYMRGGKPVNIMPTLLCIDEGGWFNIEKGRRYKALLIHKDSYVIEDDEGDIIGPEKELFQIVP